MTVFANGLEVSCKAQGCKVIAAFPDVCFTPPESPATPPGVPVPYPSFGMDNDTDKGTATVKIGGKTVTQKNKSYYTKTTGTEAGCAAKKGIITSKNMGKEYANAWSNDVKMDGEPIARFSDMATLNHASPTGNSWQLKIGRRTLDISKPCEKTLSDVELHFASHSKNQKDCADKDPELISEHVVENQFFQAGRGGVSKTFEGDGYYTEGSAPTVCMKGKKKKKGKDRKKWPTAGTDHANKSEKVRDFIDAELENESVPTVGKVMDNCVEAFVSSHENTKDKKGKEKKKIKDCIKEIYLKHLTKVINEEREDNDQKPLTEKQVSKETVAWWDYD